MRRVLRRILFITLFVLSFQSLSFADPPAKEWVPGNLIQEPTQSLRILPLKGNLFLSSSAGLDSWAFIYGARGLMENKDQEFPSESPAFAVTQSSPTDHQKKDLSLLEKGRLWKEKSSFYFGKIPFMGSNPESLPHFIPCLSVARSKEEAPSLLWNSEGLKESVILKSLAILLELRLSF